MSEEILHSSLAAHEAPEISPEASTQVLFSVGERLRTEREMKGMTTADVAQSLKLSLWQVDALEADDWSRLPGNTITRGFVRNYARLLGIDPAVLTGSLDSASAPQPQVLSLPTESSKAMPSEGRQARRDFPTALAGLLLLILAVLAYLFVPPDFWQSKLQSLMSKSSVSEQAVEKTGTAFSSAQPVQSAPAGESVPAGAALPVPPADASDRAQGIPAPRSDAGDGGLKLSFDQPAWVEIRDRSGQIVFSQLNPAGTQRDIEGQPPFALVIGNASHVSVQYKGKLVELAQRSKDDVARLNLE